MAEPSPPAHISPPVSEPESEKPAERKKLKSTKLDRTLVELENAFDSWNAEAPAKMAQPAPPAPSPGEREFKQRTRELLSQLREQLADFSND